MEGFVYDDDPKHTGEVYSNALRVYDGDAVWSRWNFGGVKDYQEAHDKSIAYIKKRKIEPRVTDPSYQLKYLREAGYRWFGAETMYTSMEAQTGVLRGVCKDAGVKAFGTHNPVQWASSPHDSPECNRRYRLALYLSYMLGASVINTEEGLWRLEEYFVDFNRFSNACKLHLKEQQDLVKYISSHTRSGEFYTPLAVVHGRLDGYNSITGKIWGIAYETEADRSWGVLEEFYPHYKTHCIYRHGCSTSEPQGWFTGTPYGCADILPIEGKPSTLAGYKTYIFTGYNKAEKSDFDKLFEQVEKGGVALMTLAHFTITTEAERVRNYDLQFDETVERFTCGAPVFVTGHYRGQEIAVCENVKTENAVVAERTDEGLPLVVRYTVGNGEIVLFNAKAYPAHIAIKELYKTYMRNVALAATAQERVWAQGDETTDFAFYKQQNGDVHAYFTAVDWYHSPELLRSVTLRIGKDNYEIRFPFGTLVKVVITESGAFAYSLEESGEVLAVNENKITVQDDGKGRFVYGKNGKTKEIVVDLSKEAVKTVDCL